MELNLRHVGSYEAKTHLPELLKVVEKGGTIVITRRGTPIAQLVPANEASRPKKRAIIERMKSARARRQRVSIEEILSARDEGRRS